MATFALQEGAISDVFDPNFIRATLHSHIKLLFVEDDLHDCRQICRQLDKIPHTDYQVTHVGSLPDANQALEKDSFDVVLLDYRLGAETGLAFLQQLRSKSMDLPVILLTQLNSVDIDRQGMHAGCIEYLPKDEVTPASLERTIRYSINNHYILKHLYHLASHDELTGLPNRSFMVERLQHAVNLSFRRSDSSALLFIDIDDFKLINDTYGHSIGDQVIQQFADTLSQLTRCSDTPCRLGGDEFLLLLEGVEPGGAEQVAEKLIKQPMLLPLNDKSIEFSCSIGIAYFGERDDAGHGSVDAIMKRADKALYQAKASHKDGYKVA